MRCNWYELTGVYFDRRQQEKELVMVMCKVDKFEGKKWWHKQKQICIICKVVSNFFPRGLCMEGNGKIIVVRGTIRWKKERKVQGVPQSQATALPRHQEEEKTDKTKQMQIEQTYEKH